MSVLEKRSVIQIKNALLLPALGGHLLLQMDFKCIVSIGKGCSQSEDGEMGPRVDLYYIFYFFPHMHS